MTTAVQALIFMVIAVPITVLFYGQIFLRQEETRSIKIGAAVFAVLMGFSYFLIISALDIEVNGLLQLLVAIIGFASMAIVVRSGLLFKTPGIGRSFHAFLLALARKGEKDAKRRTQRLETIGAQLRFKMMESRKAGLNGNH